MTLLQLRHRHSHIGSRPWLAAMIGLMLVACSSPPMQASAPATPAAASPSASPPASAPTPATHDATSQPAQSTVDATALPADVQDFILNQRMCRHFRRPAVEGGNAMMAANVCAKADDAAWKALLRKYQDDETVGSVLVAERPADAKVEE